jgi:hypothetical protein
VDESLRPILIAEHVPASDGNTYRVFVDVDDRAMRSVVRQLVLSNHLATSTLTLSMLSLRVEIQP